MTKRLFVYGTLLADSGTPAAAWLRKLVRRARRAYVQGRLFAVGTPGGYYPALLRCRGRDRAWGLLCDVRLRPRDLAALDRYEGRDYRRRTMPAFVDRSAGSPRATAAQAYVWNARLPAGACPIHDGDFIGWLDACRKRPYAARHAWHQASMRR